MQGVNNPGASCVSTLLADCVSTPAGGVDDHRGGKFDQAARHGRTLVYVTAKPDCDPEES